MLAVLPHACDYTLGNTSGVSCYLLYDNENAPGTVILPDEKKNMMRWNILSYSTITIPANKKKTTKKQQIKTSFNSLA